MGVFDKYAKVDNKQMNDGAAVDFGNGFLVTVRHASAEKVNMERERIMKQLRVMSRNRELTADQQKQITKHVAAYAGIVTWEGGDAPAFTPEFAMQVFEERPEFLDDVLTAMTSYETFRQEEIDGAVGNLTQS